MDPRKKWIREQFQKRRDLSQADLGRLLGRDRAVVTQIIKGRRRIKVDEWDTIQAFFGTTMRTGAGLPIEGAIGYAWYDTNDEGVPSAAPTRVVSPVLQPSAPGAQTAFDVQRPIPALGLGPGGVIIAVRPDKPRVVPGQWVVVRREQRGFYRYDVVEWTDAPLDRATTLVAIVIETRMPR